MGGVGRHIRVKPFKGSRNPDDYKEWRREVVAIELASKLDKKDLAVYAWMALEGEPKILTKHLSVREDLYDEKGLERIFEILDARYLRLPHKRADFACKLFERTRRSFGETM